MADKKHAKGKKKSKGSKDEAKPGKRSYGDDAALPAPTPPAPVEEGEGDSDPPIIISGGSVTIESAVFLSTSYDPAKKRFIYETKAVKIGKMKTKGKKDQDDDSDNGEFTIKLFKE